MVHWLSLVLLLLGTRAVSKEEPFEKYFHDKVLRVDIYQFGTAETEAISIHELKEEPHFAGPKDRCIDDGNLGGYTFEVYDEESNALIYSRGFSTLFGEWRTTEEARRGIQRVFEHTLIMPYPKKDMVLVVRKRKGMEGFGEILRQKLDLDRRFVRADNPYLKLKAVKILYNGDPHEKVDIVILGDGYDASEMQKYLRAAGRAADDLMGVSPFKENRRRFNIWGVKSPSPESGVDEPRKGSYKATLLETRFNAFELERYSLSMSVHTLRDVAASVPYDCIVILFNSPRFGGGGIFNLYAIASGETQGLPGVLAHEFGHSFGGLADEYYTSSVTYIDFYPLGVEPWEPNITALLDPSTPKWADLIKPGTPIPTPDEERFAGVVGCFEGAGYRTKGLFRPCRNCIMLSCRGDFCPVCRASLQRSIEFHSK